MSEILESSVAGVIDDPPGFPYTPPGVDVLEGEYIFGGP